MTKRHKQRNTREHKLDIDMELDTDQGARVADGMLDDMAFNIKATSGKHKQLMIEDMPRVLKSMKDRTAPPAPPDPEKEDKKLVQQLRKQLQKSRAKNRNRP